MQTNYEVEQLSMFGQDLWYGKMFPAPLVQERPKARTSGSFWKRSSALNAIPFQSLDLTPGAGNLLGEFYWELISPWRGGASTLNTGVSPREENGSSLSRILQEDPPKRYFLTRKACLGILRRAAERGKGLPEKLKRALEMQAGLVWPGGEKSEEADAYDELPQPVAFAANQRDEVRDLHDVAGALGAQPGMKQQTFIASFSAGAGASAGTIGYAEEVTPTLKGSPSGNCMPSVMCLHDQGGQRMDVCENMTGTLRASEKGHQPLVHENHGIDARIQESGEISPTVTARYGTGGGNTPLIQESDVYCIVGNVIDRQPENGGNGCGYQENLAYTITTCERLSGYPDNRSNPED